MAKILTILLIALVCEAVGVVFLSKGLKQIAELPKSSFADFLALARAGATNPNILLGVGLEAIFFAGLLMLLSQSSVSLIWPLTSLGFVLTTLAAKFYLHEHVSGTRWMGVGLIVIGAALITWSEKKQLEPVEIQGQSASFKGG
jgi:drug/metabolite transporter (DMT)-like permease